LIICIHVRTLKVCRKELAHLAVALGDNLEGAGLRIGFLGGVLALGLLLVEDVLDDIGARGAVIVLGGIETVADLDELGVEGAEAAADGVLNGLRDL
jgi:hypothetical protein